VTEIRLVSGWLTDLANLTAGSAMMREIKPRIAGNIAQSNVLKLWPTCPKSLSRPRMITTARPSKTETMILLRSCANTPYPVESSKLKVKS